MEANVHGQQQPFLPPPYTWKNYGDLNVEIWREHQETSLEEARTRLASSHQAVSDLIERFSDTELFTKKHFVWTGTTSLGSYCVSVTSSHYDWALAKLRKHRKTAAPG